MNINKNPPPPLDRAHCEATEQSAPLVTSGSLDDIKVEALPPNLLQTAIGKLTSCLRPDVGPRGQVASDDLNQSGELAHFLYQNPANSDQRPSVHSSAASNATTTDSLQEGWVDVADELSGDPNACKPVWRDVEGEPPGSTNTLGGAPVGDHEQARTNPPSVPSNDLVDVRLD